MLNYLLSVSLTWLLFYVAYYLLLRRERLPVANRLYLLATFLVSLLLPLLPSGLLSHWLPAAQGLPVAPGPETVVTWLPLLTVGGTGTEASGIAWLTGLLLAGGSLYGLRLIYGIGRLLLLTERGISTWRAGNRLVLLNNLTQPFTFGNRIYWDPRFDALPSGPAMLAHEAAHVRQGHTLDLLLVDLAGLLFWWNPLLYLYRRGLTAQHEFAADAAAARVSETRAYARLLLAGAVRGSAPRPAHTFFSSPLKQRIIMLTSPKGASWKLLLTLPFLLVALWACDKDSDMTGQRLLDVEPQVPLVADEGDNFVITDKNGHTITLPKDRDLVVGPDGQPVYKVVDQMPTYGVCEGDIQEIKACSDKNMLGYIYANVNYPAAAKEEQAEGLGVVGFVVPADGTDIYDVKLVRSVGGKDGSTPGFSALDQEILRVVNDMPAEWKPGLKDGRPVNVQFNLPIKFKME